VLVRLSLFLNLSFPAATPRDHYFLTCSGTNQVALESKAMQLKVSEFISFFLLEKYAVLCIILPILHNA
jgi:hypothetical protein